MARKTYKKKARSCPLCKPHKTGGGNRWKPKDEDKIRRDEKDVSEAVGRRRNDEDVGA